MLWFTDYVARYTRKGFRDLQQNLGQLNGVMEETISGQRVVKAFRRTDTAVERFRLSNQKVYKAGVYANTYALMLMPLTNVLGNFFVIVLVGLGGYLALQHLVTVGMIGLSLLAENFIQPCANWRTCITRSRPAVGVERPSKLSIRPQRDAAQTSPPIPVQGHTVPENVRSATIR
jgi:ATP-binding cassette subfamily B protein